MPTPPTPVLTDRELDQIAALGQPIPYAANEDVRGYAVDIRGAMLAGDNDLAYQLSQELVHGNDMARAERAGIN